MEITMTKFQFAKWLISKRKSLKLSQDDLAKSIGLSTTEVAKLEAGLIELPKSKIQALAVVLKVDKKFELQLKVIFHDDSNEKKKIA